MNIARPYFATAQSHVLASFAHKDLGKPCRCSAPAAETIYRCLECYKSPLYCKKCVVDVHQHTPFHHIEQWNEKHFVRASLADLGLILYTCPTSLIGRCPQVSDRSKNSQIMTLGEHNGFHTVEVEYCSCTAGIGALALPLVEQLLAVRLFPASFKSPKTVFTWTVMKQFHIHCLASKKSAYDYIKALCKLTDNAFSHNIKDRYREFQFAYRIWRFLALQRRTGQAHGIDKLVPHRRPGSLTLRCPACPEVGFNISAETIKAALESEKCRHKFTLFLSVDGNFKLQRKNKRDDPDDVALNNGDGYFVETEQYKRYVRQVKPVEDAGTCSHLRAARMQNIAKFKNAVISGVVAVQCARHGFYLPQAMVDLKKGEAFANTDYAIAYGLTEAWSLRWIMMTYDIWCQYSIYLRDRFVELFPSMADIIDKIRGAIPKMHIHGHMELCQLLWNLNWLAYSAFTVGEMIETGWAEHNLTAGSTKEQNDGNRHDSVDDTSGNWNWDKMVALAKALQRLYRVAKAELRKRSANFEALTLKHPKELIEKWEAMDITQTMEGSGKDKKLITVTGLGTSVGSAAGSVSGTAAGPAENPTISAVGAAAPTKRAGDSGLISTGLLVERDQCVQLQGMRGRIDHRRRQHVRRMVVHHAAADLLGVARRRLFNDITQLRTRLVARTPALEKYILDVDPEKPEKEKLFLPSGFTSETRASLNLQALAQVEYQLREGQAFDALADVRTAIRTLNWNLYLKKSMIHGTGSNTKGQNFLKTLSNDIQLAADTYQRAREALVTLGLAEDNAVLKPLRKSDLFGKSGKQAAMGDSKKQDSWVWTTGRAADLSSQEIEEWEAECA
ncbi:hypothetical protein B0H11DRAFT_1710585 [Mycena galericulata]|nr:hypothetical protein B0H11DRAFT_1710585 [Mycena galericulata]